MQLNEYITLGRSGLRVSPLALGTMTFGNDRWGSDDAEAKRIFDRYIQDGGNFVDTADGYAEGKSEQIVGKFVAEDKLRDRLVIATKFTFNAQEGDPNAGGNGRKNIYRALEGSLRRLNMDYIDLYWMHVWDTVTPVEEVVSTLTDLVRAGKIRCRVGGGAAGFPDAGHRPPLKPCMQFSRTRLSRRLTLPGCNRRY